MIKKKEMIVTHVFPPIPIRDFWTPIYFCAFWEDEEEGGHYGYGKTKEEAIADLKRLDQERWESEHPEEPAAEND